MPEPIRIMLVDTPVLNRRCLALALGRKRRLHVVGEAGSGPDALAGAEATQPDVVVVDPSVPGGGSSLVTDLSLKLAGRPIIVLSQDGNQASAGRALQAGARGYLQRDCEIDTLVHAIELVHEGQLVLAPASVGEALAEQTARRSHHAGRHTLTRREAEVLQLVAQGQTNHEIGNELFITEYTVKAHLAHLLGKLGLANRVQLATFATQRGIPTPADLLAT